MNGKTTLQTYLIAITLLGAPLAAQKPTVRAIGSGLATDVSEDGRHILFTDWKTGKIMLGDLESRSVEALTRRGYPDYGMYAKFSPGGTRVAYSWRGGGGHFDLRLISLDGSPPEILVPGKDESYFVRDWTPDGKAVLAKTAGALVSFTIEDGTVETLIDIPEQSFGEGARFSPDGQLLAYDLSISTINAPGDIRVYSLEERRELEGIRHPANDSLIGWTPDGRWILFISDRDGAEDLWAAPVNATGVGPASRVHDSLGLARPSVAGVTGGGSPVYSVRTWQNDLYVADYDAESNAISAAVKLDGNVDYGSGVSWSPDGNRLAYPRYSQLLVVRSVPGGHQQELNVGLRRYHDRWPHWIGNQMLLVAARPNGRESGLVAVDITNGEVVTVVENADGGAVEWETASPAGRAYYPRFQVGNHGTIVERNLKAGAERVIHRFRAIEQDRLPVRHLALSADGKWLCYVRRTQGEKEPVDSVAVIAIDGRDPRTLLTAKPSEVLYPPAWTPDGRFLLIGLGSSSRPDSKLQLWRVDISSGETVQVTGGAYPGKNMGGLSVHPAGDKLAFVLGEITDEPAYTWTEVHDEVRIVDGVADWLVGQER